MMMTKSPATLAAILLASGLAACSSALRPNASLQSATDSFAQASNTPFVVANAPLELQQAQQSLTQAQTEWRGGADSGEVDHLAYIVTGQTQIAVETAKLKQSQQAVGTARAQSAEVLLDSRTQQAKRAEAQAAFLQQQLNAKQTDKGMVLTLGSDILFDTGKSDLKSGAYPTLSKVATFLRQYPDRSVLVQGYTDSTGAAAFNQTLSLERAEAVRTAIDQNAVASSRVQAQGMGESDPVATNASEAGRQLNRRVELVFSNPSS
jgi:outer membrane protein OmpA-like peptidoglycan-associated protein